MKIKVNGVNLFFDVEGPGWVPGGETMLQRPTVVVLHGGPGVDHAYFRPVMAPLAEVAQIVYLDHRGNGRSDRSTPEHWNLATWADDVRAFCDALGIEAPIVMGTSFGGFVAQAYAIRHPGHAGKLVFSCTNARFNRGRSAAMFERFGGQPARRAFDAFFDGPTPEAFQQYIKVCLPLYSRPHPAGVPSGQPIVRYDVATHFISGEWHTFDFIGQLGGISCPTLVISGSEDPILPIEGARELAAEIRPDLVRFVCVEGSGHNVLTERPAEVLAILRAFITG